MTQRWSFEEVYRSHVMTVARWASRLGRPWLDPEDVTHDVFLKVRDAIEQLDPGADLEAWLYTVTANVVRTRRRVERFRRLFRGPAAAGQFVPSEDDPTVTLERREDRQLVLAALEALPDRDREVLVLFELEGRTGQDVARLMDVPVERVWVWLTRARQRFARVVAEKVKVSR